MVTINIENNKELRAFFLSDDDYREFCAKFRADRRVRQFAGNVAWYEKRGKYLQAAQERKKMAGVAHEMINAYVKEHQEEKELIDVKTIKLSAEDKEKLAVNAVSICMCCDMVETFSDNIQQMLKKYGDYELVQFLHIEELLKSARSRLVWLEGETDLREFAGWCKACDFYIDSIPKKAQKLIDASDARKERAKKKK